MTSTATTPGADMDHRSWMQLAQEEHQRLLSLLAQLDDEAWSRPTDCTEWDVREVVAHLAGAAASTARVRELVRQARAGRRLPREGDTIDRINAVQVIERATATPAALVAELEETVPRSLRARSRMPAPLRALRVPFGPPLGVRSLGYLLGRIYTRDAWMHRIDIARATSSELMLTPGHDGRIVADLVHEWSRAHGQPYRLLLTGPAGGTFGGNGGESLELDAVEFARIMAGRAEGDGLLRTSVPF